MRKNSNILHKWGFTLIFLIIGYIAASSITVFASDEDEINILKNRIIELEKKDIENRVLLTDVKELLARLTLEMNALKQKIEKQEELLNTIPRRVPRPAESIEVEDTTPAAVKIENTSAASKTGSETGPKQPVSTGSDRSSSIQPSETAGQAAQQSEKTRVLPGESAAESESSSEKNKLYNIAMNYFKAGSYDKALIKYKEYIDKYPDDDLTDNAQYWIGECYFKKGEYLKAVEEFQKVIEYYPLGNKVPDAYLKIGYAYLALKDKVSALQYFNLVRDMFPHTDPSIEAEKKIKELSKR